MPNSVVTISYSDHFKRQIKRLSRKYRHIRSDVQPIIDPIGRDNTPGDHIQGMGYTIYKVRVKNSDIKRGKSAGYRMIYYLKTENDVLLVTIYSKTEQSDIGPNELLQIMREEEIE